MKQLGAEFFGTFWLVLGGCGSAVLAAAFPNVGIGLLGVSFAFGLTVLTMAYAVGHISGGHFNPAVSIGLWAGGRFPANKILPYILAQVAGAVAAGGVLYLIASGQAGFDASAGFASNGYGELSPGKYSFSAALICEIVMTMMFLVIILGATDARAPQGMAPIAIGLGLGGFGLVPELVPILKLEFRGVQPLGPGQSLHALEARCAAFGRHLREVGGEGLAVVGVADLQVAHPVAGGLQRGGKGAHRSEDRQHLLRVVAHVVGLAAHLHHQVEHVGARDVEPGMGGVELVAEDEAEGGHACSLSELGSAVSAGDVEECL